MIKKIRRALYWCGLLLGGMLFAWQILRAFQSIVTNQVRFTSYGPVLLGWLGMVVLVVLQMLNWQIILRALGYPLHIIHIAKGYTLSLLPRYIPGSIWGYLSRSEWLFKEHAIPYRIGNYGSVVDILVTLFSAFIILGLHNAWLTPGGLKYGFILLSLALPVLVWLLFNLSSRVLSFRKAPAAAGEPVLQGMPFLDWLKCLLVFLVQWLLLGGVTLGLVGLFAPLDVLTKTAPLADQFAKATYAFSLAWTAGFLIIFIPGGMGVREVVLSWLLVLSFPIQMHQAVIVAILSRIVYSGAEIFWIGLGLIFRSLLGAAQANGKNLRI